MFKKKNFYENLVIGLGGFLLARRFFSIVQVHDGNKKELFLLLKKDPAKNDQIVIINPNTNEKVLTQHVADQGTLI